MKVKNRKKYISVLTLALSASIFTNSVMKVNANELNKPKNENAVENENTVLNENRIENSVENISTNTVFRNATQNIKAILPLDEKGNLLISTKDKVPSKVKVIYGDGTTEERTPDGEYVYNKRGTDIENKVNAVKSEIESITYEDFYTILSPTNAVTKSYELRAIFKNKHGRFPTEEELNAEVKKYFLEALNMEESFNRVKNNLDEILYALFEHSQFVDVEYVKQNKNKIMVGLTLLERQYNFKFGNISAKDLILYYPEFFSNYSNPITNLVNIGNVNYRFAQLAFNTNTYANKIRRITGQENVFSLVEYALPKLVPNKDLDTWFKETSKAIIYEVDNDIKSSSLVNKMKNEEAVRKYFIPLLTLTDDYIYVISTMKTTTYGLVDTYLDRNVTKDREALKEKLKHTGIHQQKFLEFWYRITEKKTEFLNYTDLYARDTFRKFGGDRRDYRNYWSPEYGEEALGGVKEFFTPMRDYVTFKVIGGEARGLGFITVLNHLLEDKGITLYSHENTHLLDKAIWFNGNGRRANKNVEVYAKGLFETVNNNSPDYPPIFNLNTGFTLGENRVQNRTPERFQNDDDLKEYMQGLFDVVYTLDYLEAEAILEKSPEDRTILLNKVNFEVENNVASDRFSNISVDEATALQNVYDFVDNKIVSGRYEYKGKSTVGLALSNSKDDYYVIPLFEPIYAALQNDNDSTGSVTFRRNSYDILGEYGYTNGMSAYLSGKYTNDRDALNAILDKKYNGNLAEFKKDMFKRRIEKVSKLKPTSKFNTFDELKLLMKNAVNEDLEVMRNNKANGVSFITTRVNAIRTLKTEIFKEYLNMTDDFRGSIYKDDIHKVTLKFNYENKTEKTQVLNVNDGESVENVDNLIPPVTDGTYKISNNFDRAILTNIKSDKIIEIPLVKTINGINLNPFEKNKISKIEIVERPTKLVYKEGEKLDLTGLKIKLTDDKGMTKVILPTELQKYGVNVSKDVNEKLIVTDSEVSFSVNGKSASLNITVNALPKNEKFEPVVETTTATYKTDESEENARNLILSKVSVEEQGGNVEKEIVGDIPKTEGNNQVVRVKVTYDDRTFDEVEVTVNVIPRDKVNYNILLKYVNKEETVLEKTISVLENTNIENIEQFIQNVEGVTYKIKEDFDRSVLNNITENKTIEIPLVKTINFIEIVPFDEENISKIEIISMPDKLEYKEGEELDLSGLKIKVTDNKGMTKVILPTELQKYGVNVSKDVNEKLIVTDSEVSFSVNEKNASLNITVNSLPKNEKFDPIVETTVATYKTDESEENARNLILSKVSVEEQAGNVGKEIVGDIPKTEGNNQVVRVKVTYDDRTFDEVEVTVNVIPRDKVNYNILLKYVNKEETVLEKTISVLENTNIENIEQFIPNFDGITYKIKEDFDRSVLNNITESKTIEIPLVKTINFIEIVPFDEENISKIEIVSMPDKLEYKEGEELDLSGLKIKVTDNKGITKVLNLINYKPYKILITSKLKENLTSEIKEVALDFGENKLKFEIKVKTEEVDKPIYNDNNLGINVGIITPNVDASKDENINSNISNDITVVEEIKDSNNINIVEEQIDKVENKKIIPKTAISNNIFYYSILSLFSLGLLNVFKRKKHKK